MYMCLVQVAQRIYFTDYTKMLRTCRTVTNEIVRKLKSTCSPKDFAGLGVAGELGSGDDVKTVRLYSWLVNIVGTVSKTSW